MKKYVAGMGLLLAALMFFGCKQTTQTFDKLSKDQTQIIKVRKGDATFDSGWTPDNTNPDASKKTEVQFYASANVEAAKAVGTLFNPAYFVKTSQTAGSVAKTDIEKALGGALYTGDSFYVGYRLVKQQSGEITRSKVVKYEIVSAEKKEVEVAAKLQYALKDWYLIATVTGKQPTLKATAMLGGDGKAVDIGEPAKKGIVTGSTTVFTWKVPKDKIIKGVPMHANFTFTDVEYSDVVARAEKVVDVVGGNVLDPNNVEVDNWVFKTPVLKADGTTDNDAELAALCAKTTKDNPPIVETIMPAIKIPNRVKLMADAETSIALKSVTYRYAFTESETAPDTKDASWIVENAGSSAEVTFKPKANLDYNKTYYLHVKGSYVKKDKVAPETIEEVSEEAFATKTTFPAIFFKTADGLNEGSQAYDMDADKKTTISKAEYYLPGHVVKDVPSALKTDADSITGAVKFDENKWIESHHGSNAKQYTKGDLSFTMRLPGESAIESMINAVQTKPNTYITDSAGTLISGAQAGPKDLWILDFNGDIAGKRLKVVLRYFAPTLAATKKTSEIVANTPWTYTPGKVCLVVEANGDTGDDASVSEPIFTTTYKLANGKKLEGRATDILNNIAEIATFDANAWVADKDIAVIFDKTTLTVKIDGKNVIFEKGKAKDNPVKLDKAKNIDINEYGYSYFKLKSGLDGIRVKKATYKVTK